MALDNGNGRSNTQILIYVLGIALAILFAAVGLVVQDIRSDIEQNQRVVIDLQHALIRLQGELHEEQSVTMKVREWYGPRITHLEQQVRQLQKVPVIPPEP